MDNNDGIIIDIYFTYIHTYVCNLR